MAITIPLMSVYQFNNDLLSGLHVPTEADLPPGEYISPIPALSDEDLRNTILIELGELEPIYTDPDFLQSMITLWNATERQTWIRLWATTLYKYNPIWNKDGKVTETRAFQLTGTTSGSDTSNNTRTFNEANTEDKTTSTTTSGTTSGSSTHSVTGYDTNSLSPESGDSSSGTSSGTGREVVDLDGTHTGTITDRGGGTSSGTASRSENETFERVEQGNIGVTTTQAMIKEQREIVEFNLYHYIVESFKRRFMVQLWDI